MELRAVTLRKRGDIQILRGFAVLSVLLFHVEPDVFRSGFLGVDTFFVISGFVITPLMIASVENTSKIKYPIADFYRKRIYRLAPAFGVTIICSLICIFLIGNLKDHDRFLKQGISALLLVGNFSAPKLSGDYFRPFPNPLIHTWSISLEEQIYIILPALFLCLRFVFKLTTKSYLTIFCVLSAFSASLFFFPNLLFPIFSFFDFIVPAEFGYYFTLSRLWQFCFGSIAYFLSSRYVPLKGKKIYEIPLVISLISLLLVNSSLNANVLSVLVTVITSMTLIFGFPLLALGKTLRVFYWIGDRSYSIYLVHMPIVYLAMYSPLTEYQVGTERYFLSILAFLASIYSGYLLHKYVEQRFRIHSGEARLLQMRIGVIRTLIYFHLVPLMASLLMLISLNNAYFGLWREDKVPYAQDSYAKECKKVSPINLLPCYFPRESLKKNALLVGDSHAVAMIYAVNETANAAGFELHYGGDLDDTNKLDLLIDRIRPELIILSRYWHLENGTISKKLLFEVDNLNRGDSDLLIVGQNPVFPDETLFRNQRSIFNGLYIAPKSFAREEMDKNAFQAGEAIERFALTKNIDFLSTNDIFCNELECSRWSTKGWLFWDDDHLSILGAKELIPSLDLYLSRGSRGRS